MIFVAVWQLFRSKRESIFRTKLVSKELMTPGTAGWTHVAAIPVDAHDGEGTRSARTHCARNTSPLVPRLD